MRRAFPHCGSPARVAVARLSSARSVHLEAEPISVFDLTNPVEPGDRPVVVRVQELLPDDDEVQVVGVSWKPNGRLLVMTETPTRRRPGIVNVQMLHVDVDAALADRARKRPAVLERKHNFGHVVAEHLREPGLGGYPAARRYLFSHDRRWLAELMDLRVWDVESGALKNILELPAPKSGKHHSASLAFSPEDSHLAIATSEGVYAYDLQKQVFVAEHTGRAETPRQVSWHGSDSIVSVYAGQYGKHREQLSLRSRKTRTTFERAQQALDPSPQGAAETPVPSPEFGFFVPAELRDCWQSLVERGLVAPSAERLMAHAKEVR
jgi:hypothetical protein